MQLKQRTAEGENSAVVKSKGCKVLEIAMSSKLQTDGSKLQQKHRAVTGDTRLQQML